MSCFSPNKGFNNRTWSRIQLNCSLSTTSNNMESNIAYKTKVLSYPNNSSRVTKQQRYSQIVRGNWNNRPRSWATQSDIYTNPNTLSEYPLRKCYIQPKI